MDWINNLFTEMLIRWRMLEEVKPLSAFNLADRVQEAVTAPKIWRIIRHFGAVQAARTFAIIYEMNRPKRNRKN